MVEIPNINLGELRIGDQIGCGGFGIVYEGYLTHLDDFKVAVKVLNPSAFQGPNSYDRFKQEAKILMQLRHPNIIPLFGCGVSGGKPYIIMERFKGFNLQEARDSFGSPKPSAVLHFCRKIASALGNAHSQGFIHRDLKPTNLMTRSGDGRVIDFGVAKIIDPDGSRFTRTGYSAVSGGFCAPELYNNPMLQDPRTDIYSFGAVWYWLLTGIVPVEKDWEKDLSEIPEMPHAYGEVIRKCLDHISKRYESMFAVERDIIALIEGRQPGAAHDGVTDDESLTVLGCIFENGEDLDDEGVSFGQIEINVTTISKLRLKIIIDNLVSQQVIKSRLIDDYGGKYTAYTCLPLGKHIVRLHQSKIEGLLSALKTDTASNASATTTTEDPDNSAPF